MANEKEWQQDISTTVDAHTNTIADHEERITANKVKLDEHETRIDNIETTTDVGQITLRVNAIEQKNTEQDTSIEELQDKDTALEQSINANKTLITNEQADRAKAIDDIKNYYYPLTGGALTQQTICRNVDDDCLCLYGGTRPIDDNNNPIEQGAILILNGKDRVVTNVRNDDISCTLRAVDTNSTPHDLNVKASGKLEWNGKNIVRSVNNVNADANGNVNIIDKVYPVGSIYMSVVNNSPANFIGGTWVALNEGRVLIGANSTYTAGKTGGEFTHKITVAELPEHNHSASTASAGAHTHTASTNSTGNHAHNYVCYKTAEAVYNVGGGSHIMNVGSTLATTSAGTHSHTVTIASADAHTHTVTVNNTGSGSAMNNMQPYLAVYMWKRTA